VGADEQRLLDDLARLVRERDPAPAELLEAARQNFTWRTIDAELAELVTDSEQPQGAALIRSTIASVRLLAFATENLRLDLEVLAEGSLRRLVGELDPGGPARVVVEYAGGALTEDTDDFGRFLICRVPGGLVRLRCQPRSGRPLLTPWLKV
jgi:hypothetical protein